MSGVYIKGMEMPENCDDCLLGADCPHDQSMDGYKMQGGRPRTCPLVFVPPHGDLIDRREAIIDANERAYDFWLSDDEVNASIQFLKEQPTIVPADPAEEGE